MGLGTLVLIGQFCFATVHYLDFNYSSTPKPPHVHKIRTRNGKMRKPLILEKEGQYGFSSRISTDDSLLSDMEYYAIEKDYKAAAEKAEAKLDVDLAEMARKYNTLSGDLKRYYENRVFIDLPTLQLYCRVQWLCRQLDR